MNVPSATLHLVLGPWASGKSTLASRLVALLPECVVFDRDLIIPALSRVASKDVFADSSTWDGLYETWFAVVGAVLAGGHDVVLCCSVEPDAIPADVVPRDRIRVAVLDCPDDVLRVRLLERGESEAAISDELAEAAAFRAAGYVRLLGGDRDPDSVAAEVVDWVRSGA